MKILDFFKAKKSLGNPMSVESDKYFDQRSIGNFTTPKEQLATYTQMMYVSVCVDKISKDIASQDYFFCDKEGKKINPSEELIYPFRSKESEDFSTFLSTITSHLLLTGNAYVHKRTNKDSDFVSMADILSTKTTSFFQMNPSLIEIILNKKKDQILGYKYSRPDSQKIDFDPDQIIHFKQNSINCDFKGIGNIEKMRLLAENHVQNSLFANEFMSHSAKPSIIITDETRGTEKAAHRKSEMITERFTRSNGKAFYASGDKIKVESVSTSFKDIEFLEQKKYTQEAIYELFGAFKLTDGTNRATAEIKRLNYLQNTINPMLILIEKAINKQYVSFVDPNVFFKLKKHPTGDSEKIILLMKSGILTPNRATEILGFEVENEDYLRDSYFYPNDITPSDFLAPAQEEVPPPLEDDKSYPEILDEKRINEILTRQFKKSRRHKLFQLKYLKAALKVRASSEKLYLFYFKKLFKEQGKRFLKNLEEQFDHLKSSFEISRKNTVLIEGVEVDLDIIFSTDYEDAVFINQNEKLLKRGISDTVLELSGITGSFLNADSVAYINMRKQLGAKITRCTDWTKKQTGNLIVKSLEEGETLDVIQNKLKGLFNGYEGYRTRRIARTESRIAWDHAAQEYYKTELDVTHVDVVGCEDHGGGWDCGKLNTPIEQATSLNFHPNHAGSLAPSKEP